MSQSEIRTWVESLQRFGIKPGLERTRAALELIGNPQNEFESVLVAGTNGKGSTAAFLSHLLVENKYKTAFFPNPHLTDLTEWFQVNNQKISNAQFEQRAVELRKIVQSDGLGLTHFEFLTVLALQYFADQKTEWAILECGLGGRLDATNVVAAKAACITNIALEHQEILGHTKREIAFEKAGIMKKKQPVLTTESDANILSLFSDLANASDSRLLVYTREFNTKNESVSLSQNRFDFEGFGFEWKNLKNKLIGEHQIKNASLAVATGLALKRFHGVRCGEGTVRKALFKTVWPGRFEIVSQKPLVILDACHNSHGAKALAQTLFTVLPRQKFRLVFGTSIPRNPGDLLQELSRFASDVIFCQAKYKGIPIFELQKAGHAFFPAYKIKVVTSPADAVDLALENLPPNGAVLVTGSIYMLREALQSKKLVKLAKTGSKPKTKKTMPKAPQELKEQPQ